MTDLRPGDIICTRTNGIGAWLIHQRELGQVTLRIGELCAGYGGLGMGVQAIYGGTVAWVSDIDKGANKILAHRFPDAPNIGDMTGVDWGQVEPVDILCGGTPCQDLSTAGKRAGMTEGTRSNLWVAMREATAQLRPGLVVWENVGGAYSAGATSELERDEGLLGGRPGRPALRALGRVLGDLASLGYDARWHGLRAADVGAPHGRLRVFVVAEDTQRPGWGASRYAAPRQTPSGRAPALAGRPGRVAADEAPSDLMLPSAVALLPTPTTRDHKGANQRGDATCLTGALLPQSVRFDPNETTNFHGIIRDARWGDYAAAIARWEPVVGRPAPEPTQTSRKGNPQPSEAFVEWMMGLPAGWVVDVPGVTRNEALKALGNGVVPQQAAAALRVMASWEVAA